MVDTSRLRTKRKIITTRSSTSTISQGPLSVRHTQTSLSASQVKEGKTGLILRLLMLDGGNYLTSRTIMLSMKKERSLMYQEEEIETDRMLLSGTCTTD
jgi:hypothetical protein